MRKLMIEEFDDAFEHDEVFRRNFMALHMHHYPAEEAWSALTLSPPCYMQSVDEEFWQAGYGAELHVSPATFANIWEWTLLPEPQYLEQAYARFPWLKRLPTGTEVKVIVERN